mgnify:CR=1 FL=1
MRQRNEHFVYANNLTKKESLDYKDAWGNYDMIQIAANEYRDEVKDAELILAKDNEILKIPYITRFSTEYTEAQEKKIRALKKKISQNSVFMTLTIDPSRFSSLFSAFKHLKKSFHKLMNTIIKNVMRDSGEVKGEYKGYIAVLEFQKNGAPHLHVLLNGIVYVNADWLRNLWNKVYSVGIFVNLKPLFRANYAINYMIKYLTKSLNHDRILAWALNARFWSCALSLIHDLDQVRQKIPKPKSGWIYLGHAPRGIIETYADALAYFAG